MVGGVVMVVAMTIARLSLWNVVARVSDVAAKVVMVVALVN